MSMPPSGVTEPMDEEALIEAEIQFELENIDLDNDDFNNDDLNNNDLDLGLHEIAENQQDGPSPLEMLDIPGELNNYIRMIEEQSSRFEKELLECDDIINHTNNLAGDPVSTAMIPYEDHNLLMQLAADSGCDIDTYKQKILDDIERDEDIIVDELEDLIESAPNSSPGPGGRGQPLQITEGCGQPLQITQHGEGGDEGPQTDDRMSTNIQQAVEEGIVPDDTPVDVNRLQTTNCKDVQKKLREQLEKLEKNFEDKFTKIKKEEAYNRNEDDVRQRRIEEERLWKTQERQREKEQIVLEREIAQKEIDRQQEEAEKQMKLNIQKFESEMEEVQRQMDRERHDLQIAIEQERQRKVEKQTHAVTTIQKTFRGYRVRKEVKASLEEKKVIRKKFKEEERIKEVEIEIEQRKEDKRVKEEKEREKIEEEKRLKEEEKQQKILEKQQKEEEKRRLKEEEKRLKQEEKAKKEEEKRRLKEEEKARKEEEKRLKEEEKLRKEEEKKLKQEAERKRKEEEKRIKEEEKSLEQIAKLKKENENKLKENEAKKIEDKQNLVNEESVECQSNSDSVHDKTIDKVEGNNEVKVETKTDVLEMKSTISNENSSTLNAGGENKNIDKVVENIQLKIETKTDTNTETKTALANETSKTLHAGADNSISINEDGINDTKIENGNSQKEIDKVNKETNESISALVIKREKTKDSPRLKTPRSARKPHPPSPRKKHKEMNESLTVNDDKDIKKVPEVSPDCLPEHMEVLRLKFIKDCLPWSQISNEPWKLKAGITKRPLRRPSSAKKLPVLQESVILQAARVASLKQVTTVQLDDLPGNQVSSLGQCWGLQYLSLHNCGLVAVDGLGQCKQLQYLDVRNNKIEYLDVHDIGKLQYVNVSHNKMSSIHGLDNCTNLRWLDLSYNNITKIVGIESLRRLHTLDVSHNQLISAQGLGDTPTLQRLNLSHNHLQSLEDIQKLCLLVQLDMSANNLLEVPILTNQVLLQELLLNDNSISSLGNLSTSWLPLLNKINLSQNSLEELTSLHNCLVLKDLDLSSNQLSDCETIVSCVSSCLYVQNLNIDDNPVVVDLNDSFYSRLRTTCPRFQTPSDASFPSVNKTTPIKPRTSYEAMCLTQGQTHRDIVAHFTTDLKSIEHGVTPIELSKMCDVHFKFCDKLFNVSVEHRYTHEYGDVSVTMPTAPTVPKSGRPSSRQKDKIMMNPKDLFDNALNSTNNNKAQLPQEKTSPANSFSNPKDLFNMAVQSSNKPSSPLAQNGAIAEVEKVNHTSQKENHNVSQSVSNPKDLFEQALMGSKPTTHTSIPGQHGLTNGNGAVHGGTAKKNSKDQRHAAATKIQAYWRGWLVRRHMTYGSLDPAYLEHLHLSAIKIQASWRGFILRKNLFAALEYAQQAFGDDDEEDEDVMMMGDFDIDKFVNMDEDLLDTDWKPPETPDIPAHHAVLRKPPSGRARVPPIGGLNPAPSSEDQRPPSNPRRAWKNMESPLSDIIRVPRPPSSVASTDITIRSGVSRKEEQLTEEWGFKDTNTAHLMMQRAKKMKYNAERRKKISKLDPKQRLALFRRLEEVSHPETYTAPQRKTLPRKEYFQARENEVRRVEDEKKTEFTTRASRTYEWLHTHVGVHTDVATIPTNQTISTGPKYTSENNLPELMGGRRVQLVSSPGSMELQSIDSVSSAGNRPRRFSAGTGNTVTSKLPPIQTLSAPTSHVKEKMSFRNPKPANQSVGWGGGKKRAGRM